MKFYIPKSFLKQHGFINNSREKISCFKILNMIIYIFIIIFILLKLHFINFSYFAILLLYYVEQHVSWTCIYTSFSWMQQRTCCWFSRCVVRRASTHCRVSRNACLCANSRGWCVNAPATFVPPTTTIELNSWNK